jgi:hypothetical protein
MANNCYNHAILEGSKEMLDLLENRLKEATKLNDGTIYNKLFYAILELPENDLLDSRDEFGASHFDPIWDRQSDTIAALSGDSAWSPVSAFFKKLSEVYQLKIESDFEEGGSNIGGWRNYDKGETTRDEFTTYYAYRYRDDEDSFMQSLLEDASSREFDSVDDIDEELMKVMSEEHKKELIDAINENN